MLLIVNLYYFEHIFQAKDMVQVVEYCLSDMEMQSLGHNLKVLGIFHNLNLIPLLKIVLKNDVFE